MTPKEAADLIQLGEYRTIYWSEYTDGPIRNITSGVVSYKAVFQFEIRDLENHRQSIIYYDEVREVV